MYESGPGMIESDDEKQDELTLEPEFITVAERLYKVSAEVRNMTGNVATGLIRESHLEAWPKNKPIPPAALRGIREKVVATVEGGARERSRLKQSGANGLELARVENIVMAHVNALIMLEKRGQ